jgi:hypothetical protein
LKLVEPWRACAALAVSVPKPDTITSGHPRRAPLTHRAPVTFWFFERIEFQFANNATMASIIAESNQKTKAQIPEIATSTAAQWFLTGWIGGQSSSGPRLPSDEPGSFERQHHLVNRRRADAKILLHVGFSRRPAVQARVEVNKRQILALLSVRPESS